MKENLLSIKINVSVEELFSFTINPENTHKWIDSIQREYIEGEKIQKGTVYKNYGDDGIESSYIVHDITSNTLFHLKSFNSSYEVIYFYNKINDSESILNYYEFNSDLSNLESPFEMNTLNKLKYILEK